jgi:hypothetical protein
LLLTVQLPMGLGRERRVQEKEKILRLFLRFSLRMSITL